MASVEVFVETDVAIAFERGVAAWVFDLPHWGRCGQGLDETAAVADLGRQLGTGVDLVVVERIQGDEQAFTRDRQPCNDDERQATLTILAGVRRLTIELITARSGEELDWDDPTRRLPAFAKWRTLRQLAWHIVDTESRYYLPQAGLGYRDPALDLRTELTESATHVRRVVQAMPADLLHERDGETWTSTKLLRRLAWHERGELAVMQALAKRGSTGGHALA